MRWWTLGALLHCGAATASADPALDTPHPADTPGSSCLDALSATGAVFVPAPFAEPPALPGCGMREPVVVSRGPTGVEYRPAIRVSCAFALVLPAVEGVLQETAARILPEPIRVVRTLGSYGCRTIHSIRSPGRLSQHALGNAIDIGELQGATVRASVLQDFRAETMEGRFLRSLAANLRLVSGLERVLDPDYNSDHRNHFHLEGHPLPPESVFSGPVVVESENR
jgi:hypothetical protein